MNDIIFSSSFCFRTIVFKNYGYTDNRQGSPSHYFAYMLSGKCKIVTPTYSVDINEGDIFYIPNKCSYQSYWYGNPEIKFISLGFLFMPNFDNKTYPVQVLPESDEAYKLFCLFKSKNRLSAQDIGKFYTLAGILIPTMTSVNMCRSKEITEIAKQYILQNPFAKTHEIAKHCAISQAALYSAFKKSSDITLNQLRNNILLENAKNMLISTDKSIECICDTLNFSSTSYFRKKFKDYFDMTPSQVRKKYRI